MIMLPAFLLGQLACLPSVSAQDTLRPTIEQKVESGLEEKLRPAVRVGTSFASSHAAVQAGMEERASNALITSSYARKMEYGNKAREWVDKWSLVPVVVDYLRRVMAGGSSRIGVLEVGAAQGGVLTAIEAELANLEPSTRGESPVHYTAVDRNVGLLDVGRQLHPGFTFVQSDLLKDDFSAWNRTQHVVIAPNVLHELFSSARLEDGTINAEQGKQLVRDAARTIVRLVKPRGIFVVFDGVLPDDPDQMVRIRFRHPVAKQRFEFFLEHYAAFKVQPRWYADGWEVEIPMHYFSRYLLKYYDSPLKSSWMQFEMERQERLPPGLPEYLKLKASADYNDKGVWAIERLESAQYFTVQQFMRLFKELGIQTLHVERMSSFPGAKQLDIEILTPGVTFPQQKILIVGMKNPATGMEEKIPFNKDEVRRVILEILHYSREAASLTKGSRSLGGMLSSPEALPLLKAYRAQLKLLKLLGLMTYVLYPAIGVDYLPTEVSKEILGVDSADPEYLDYSMQLIHEPEIRTLDPTFTKDFGMLRDRLIRSSSWDAIEPFLDRVHQKHEPATIFLKGFDWMVGLNYQEAFFSGSIDPFLKSGDAVVLFGVSRDLAPFLGRLGYANYFGQAGFLGEIQKTLEQVNEQLLKVGYPPEPFGTRSGVMLHLAEPFMVLQKLPPTEKGTLEVGRAALLDFVARHQSTIDLLTEGRLDTVNLPEYFRKAKLDELARKAGYREGLVQTLPLIGLPPDFIGNEVPVFVQDKENWREKIEASLAGAKARGAIRFVLDPKDAYLVIGEEKAIPLQPGQVFIGVNEQTVSRVTPGLLQELQHRGLLEPGSVVILYRASKDSVLIFA